MKSRHLAAVAAVCAAWSLAAHAVWNLLEVRGCARHQLAFLVEGVGRMRMRKYVVHFGSEGSRDAGRHCIEDQPCGFIGKSCRTEEAGECGHEDQERKQRGQDRQRNVARDCPAVILREAEPRIPEDEDQSAHAGPVPHAFAHSDDAAATHLDPGAAHGGKRA